MVVVVVVVVAVEMEVEVEVVVVVVVGGSGRDAMRCDVMSRNLDESFKAPRALRVMVEKLAR
jgi:hypothetical protein